MALIMARTAHDHAAVVEELKHCGKLLLFFSEYCHFQFYPIAENTGRGNGQGAVAGKLGATGLIEVQDHAALAQQLVG